MELVYRPIRGSLEESLKCLKSFQTLYDLFLYVSCLYNYDIKDLSICAYDSYPDSRTWWNETYYFCHKDNVIGFVGTL